MPVITRASELMEALASSLSGAGAHRRRTGRPFCTLTYAQSLDGCIAHRPGNPIALSCPDSMLLTHSLRSLHDAILVGIRTVLTDNPRLNVRLVDGPSPQPVVLDSNLRIPSDCRLLRDPGRRPWLASGEHTRPRWVDFEARGARVFGFPVDEQGWVEIDPFLRKMGELQVDSLMIEGGARVLTSFMLARAVDLMIVTIAPVVLGGLHAFGSLGCRPEALPRLENVQYARCGRDLIMWGNPSWEED